MTKYEFSTFNFHCNTLVVREFTCQPTFDNRLSDFILTPKDQQFGESNRAWYYTSKLDPDYEYIKGKLESLRSKLQLDYTEFNKVLKDLVISSTDIKEVVKSVDGFVNDCAINFDKTQSDKIQELKSKIVNLGNIKHGELSFKEIIEISNRNGEIIDQITAKAELVEGVELVKSFEDDSYKFTIDDRCGGEWYSSKLTEQDIDVMIAKLQSLKASKFKG